MINNKVIYKTLTASTPKELDDQINKHTKDMWAIWAPTQAVYKEHGKLLWYCLISKAL